MTTKTELAIDFIAKHNVARSPEIAEASGMRAIEVSSRLYPYVQAGVLVSCQVSRPGMKPCNEYRLGGHVPGDAWREFKINVHSQKNSAKPPHRGKSITPPAPTPADRPQVSVNNSGSTQVVPPATGRAVTDKKPHRMASQPAPGAGGHVPAKAAQNIPENIPETGISKFGYFSDGSVRIVNGERAIELDAADAKRLADFLMNCMISNEVNA